MFSFVIFINSGVETDGNSIWVILDKNQRCRGEWIQQAFHLILSDGNQSAIKTPQKGLDDLRKGSTLQKHQNVEKNLWMNLERKMVVTTCKRIASQKSFYQHPLFRKMLHFIVRLNPKSPP